MPTLSVLRLPGAFDEIGDVVVEADAVFVLQVHHVARSVVIELDIFLQGFGQAEVLHGVFCGEERSGQVVVAVFHLHKQLGVGDHRLRQVLIHVWGAGESESALLAASPVPTAERVRRVVVNLVLAEFQLVVIVGIDERGESATDGRAFGIA